MNCWQNLFHLLADVREFFVNWAAIVVETRCLEDDPSGAYNYCHCENPQEQSVENHCHVFPVLFGLGENKYEGWPGIRSIFLATDGGISKFGSNAKANQFLFFNQIPNLFLSERFFFNLYGLCVKEAWQILLNYQSFSLGDTIEGIFSELFSESCCKSDELINVRLPIWKEKLSPRPNRTPSNFRSNQEKSQKEEQPNVLIKSPGTSCTRLATNLPNN